MERLHGPLKALHTAFVLGPGKRRVMKHYARLNTYRHLSEAQRNQERDRLARDIVRFAYDHVPFYRRLYNEAGVDVRSVGGVDDLPLLPLVTKDRLRAASPASIKPGPGVRLVTVRASTSGSSGSPVVVYRSLDSIFLYGAQLLAYFDTWGLADRRKVFFLLYNADPTIGVNLPYTARLSFLNRDHSVNPQLPVPEIAERIWEGRPHLVVSHPTTVELFTDFFRDSGKIYEDEIVFATGGEMLSPSLRRKIEETYPRSRTFDIYNTVETGLTAFECPQEQGMQVNENAIVIEKGEEITTATGARYVRPIFTNLWNRGTPLIRYTGIEDLLLLRPSATRCGFGDTVIDEVSGRVSQLLHSPDTRPCSVCNMMSAHAELPGVRRFQYVQSDPQRLVLRYVAEANADHTRIRREAEASVRRLLGRRIEFDVQTVDSIAHDPQTIKTPMLVSE